MTDWFYGKEGAQHGPVSEQKIKHLLFSNEITPSTIIWCEGMADWLPISEVPEFQSSLPTTPTTPPPTASSAYQAPASQPSPIYAPGQASLTPPMGIPMPTSGLAIASLVCGILALLACYLWGIFGLPAVICGHMALKTINTSTTPIQGKGMAIAGLICGYIGILIQVVTIALIILAFANAKSQVNNMQSELRKIPSIEESTDTPPTPQTPPTSTDNPTPQHPASD